MSVRVESDIDLALGSGVLCVGVGVLGCWSRVRVAEGLDQIR